MTDESATVQREEKEKIMVLRNLFGFQISEISGNLETNFIYLFYFIYSLFNVDNTVKKHCLQTI